MAKLMCVKAWAGEREWWRQQAGRSRIIKRFILDCRTTVALMGLTYVVLDAGVCGAGKPVIEPCRGVHAVIQNLHCHSHNDLEPSSPLA